MRGEKTSGAGIRLSGLTWWQRAPLMIIGAGVIVYLCFVRGAYWSLVIAVGVFLADRRLRARVDDPASDPRSDPTIPTDRLQQR